MAADNTADKHQRMPERGYGIVVGRLLLVLACYFFLSGLMQSLVSLRGLAAGLGGVTLGLILGVASGSLGVVLDMPIAGRADRLGKRRVMYVGMASSLAAAILLSFDSRPLLIVGALMAGVGTIATGNALLSWLGSAAPSARQARLQGINGSVQRIGALLAAGAVGLAIALHRTNAMSLSAVIVATVALAAMSGRAMRAGDARPSAPRGRILASYATGLSLVRRRRIVLASAINLAINVIFLATNSYVPLLHGADRAVIVTCTLVARDVAAIAFGAAIAASGVNMASPVIVVPALALAGLATWAASYLEGSLLLIAVGAVQGATVGIGIAATNLFTISAAPAKVRTLAMAAAIFPSRVMFLILPIGCSLLLKTAGLSDVFRLLAAILLALAVTALIAGRAVASVARGAATAEASPVRPSCPGP